MIDISVFNIYGIFENKTNKSFLRPSGDLIVNTDAFPISSPELVVARIIIV